MSHYDKSPYGTTALLASPTRTAALNNGAVLKIPRQGQYQPLTDDTLTLCSLWGHLLVTALSDLSTPIKSVR